MDLWVIITAIAVVIGMIAGLIQVIDYIEKKRRERKAADTPPPPATAQPQAIPSNLPPRMGFVGREKDKLRVREALLSRWPLTCIDGIGGIGKTALALEVATECYQASRGEIPAEGIPTFEGFMWVSARDRPLVLNDILDVIARTLDYPGIAQQPLDEKRESVRRLLQGKRYLLIVDNLETITDDSVRDFLLRLPEPCRALITSREQKLRQAWAVSLEGMEQEEALTLIRSEGERLGLEAIEHAPRPVLLRLYTATGGAPLAMRWAVGQIKQRGQSLDTVLAALYRARGDIFHDIFSRSWSLLGAEARHILMVMPIFAASALKATIEAASDVHTFALDDGLGQLVEMRLVDVTDQLDESRRRYSVHSLTRAFARAEAERDPQLAAGAERRLAAWLLQFAQGIRDNRAAYDILDIELPNILKSVEWCYHAARWQDVLGYRHALLPFLEEHGYWDEALGIGAWALEAAETLHDPAALAACCLRPFGWVHRHRENLAEARHWYERALTLFEETGDRRGTSWARLGLGDVAWRAGDIDAARAIYEPMRAASETVDVGTLQVTILLHLSRLARVQGRPDEAETLGLQAQRIAEQIGDPSALAAAYALVASALYEQGRLDEAQALFTSSLQLNQANDIGHGIAWNKAAMARIAEKKGDTAAALRLAREAGELHRKLGMKREMDENTKLLARLGGGIGD